MSEGVSALLGLSFAEPLGREWNSPQLGWNPVVSGPEVQRAHWGLRGHRSSEPCDIEPRCVRDMLRCMPVLSLIGAQDPSSRPKATQGSSSPRSEVWPRCRSQLRAPGNTSQDSPRGCSGSSSCSRTGTTGPSFRCLLESWAAQDPGKERLREDPSALDSGGCRRTGPSLCRSHLSLPFGAWHVRGCSSF